MDDKAWLCTRRQEERSWVTQVAVGTAQILTTDIGSKEPKLTWVKFLSLVSSVCPLCS